MDLDRKLRLQQFLSIIDTFHDFADDNRGDLSSNENSSLVRDVIMNLTFFLFDAIDNERIVLGLDSELSKKLHELKVKIFQGKFKLPSNYKDKSQEIIFDSLQSKFIIHEEKLDFQDSQLLYDHLKYKFNKNIKYILDVNREDNNLFCINSTYKSIFAGKFRDYDNQKSNPPFISINSYFKSNASTSKSGAGKFKYNCVLNEDKFDYALTKIEKELFCFDQLGVKFTKKYFIYHQIENKDYIIDLHLFNDSRRGLPLFIQAFMNYKNHTIDTINKLALDTILKVFKIKFKGYITDQLPSKFVELNEDNYILALFDLKRSMDYLQVKAAIIGNNITSVPEFNNTKIIYVSSDQLSILHAILNNCPCIHTTHEGNKLYYLELIEPNTQNAGSIELKNDKLSETVSVDKEDIISYINFDDIITENNKDLPLYKFLKIYREKFMLKTLPFYLYLTFKIIFDFTL